MLLLAVMLCGTEGAAKAEQVLLPGDTVVYQPVKTALQEIDGIPTLTKVFVLPPEDDPTALREQPFTKDGYWFSYVRMEKTEELLEDKRTVDEEVKTEAPSENLAKVQ